MTLLLSESKKKLRILARLRRNQMQHALGETRLALSGTRPGPRAVILVLGCQRSGTTLVTELFATNPQAKIYPEHSALSVADRRDRLRLTSLPVVSREIAKSRFPLVVLKPLVESQRAPELLSAIDSSRAIWMFRDWRDVARSNLKRFGNRNGLKNLRGVVNGDRSDWRSEHHSAEVLAVVSDSLKDDISAADAASLFWWVRNMLYFSRGLATDERIQLRRYEDLIDQPVVEFESIYQSMGLPARCHFDPLTVSRHSLGRGSDLIVSPHVAERCSELQSRLMDVYRSRR